MRKGLWLIVLLFLLLLACESSSSSSSTPPPEVWASCKDREDFQVCKGCRIVEQFTTDVARFGRVKDTLTGWERRVVIALSCELVER